jgi:DNA-binding beta-propeller fold protein YncE
MVDKTTNKTVAQIPKDGPLQTVTTPDGKTTYSVVTSENEVLVRDGDSDDPDRIRVDEGPFGLALSSDGTKLFVFSTSTEGKTISVIDTREEEVQEVDPAPAYNFQITVTPGGHLAAVN